MIPSGHNGPDKQLVAKLAGNGSNYVTRTSHYLMNPEYDNVTRRLNELHLNNALGDKVKVYFIPSYLNGNDGIFNMSWDDLTVFFQFPLEIRNIIYTTNLIENLNGKIRKYTKSKLSFPSDDAVKKTVFLSLMEIEKKWTQPIHNCFCIQL